MQGPIAAAYFLRIHGASDRTPDSMWMHPDCWHQGSHSNTVILNSASNNRGRASRTRTANLSIVLCSMFLITAVVVFCHLFTVAPRRKHSNLLSNHSKSGKLVGLAILAIHKSYHPTINHSNTQEQDADGRYEREILRLQHELQSLRKEVDAVILDEREQLHKEGPVPVVNNITASTTDLSDQESTTKTTKSSNDNVFQEKLFQQYYNQSKKD